MQTKVWQGQLLEAGETILVLQVSYIFPLNSPYFVVPQDSQRPLCKTALCHGQFSPPSFSPRDFCSLSLPRLIKLSYPTIDAVQDHRIMGWFGLERPFKGHLVQPPPAMGRDSIHQVRQLRALPNLAFNISRDGEPTTSLGNLRVRRMENATRTDVRGFTGVTGNSNHPS